MAPQALSLGRIDTTNKEMVEMDPTNVPKQRRRLNQASTRAGANRVIWGEMDHKGPDEDHKTHIRRDTLKGST